MQHRALIPLIVILVGCTSTRVIDAAWDDESTTAEVRRLTDHKDATVLLRNERSIESRGVWLEQDTLWAVLAAEAFRPSSATIVPLVSGETAEAIPLSRVQSIRVRAGRQRGDLRAVLWGFLVGTAIGYAVDQAADTEETEYDNCFPLSPCEKRIDRAKGALWIGALAGTTLGAIWGSKRYIAYRFRRDTPQQMSVVIRAGNNGGE